MQTLSYLPPLPLSSLVERFWVCRSEHFNYCSRMLPMLHHELVVNFSDRFEVAAGGQTLVSDARAWVSGLQTRPVQAFTAGRHFTAGVLFKPWGLSAFSKVEAGELRDQSVSLTDIFGASAGRLAEEIHASHSPREVFGKLETFLGSHLSGPPLPPYLVRSLESLQSRPLSDNLVNGLARQSGVSAKTLIGHYKKYIGLTPAKYHHLLVLNRLLRQLAENQGQSLTETAYALEFFDQAHLIHFFRQYTDFTPSAYLAALRGGKTHPANPNSVTV